MPAHPVTSCDCSLPLRCAPLAPLTHRTQRLQQHRTAPGTGAAATLQHYRHLLPRHPWEWWRGTLPTIIRNVPGTSLYFYALHHLREGGRRLLLVPAENGRGISIAGIPAPVLIDSGSAMLARVGM